MNLQGSQTVRSSDAVETVGIFLRDLIDYAGLFPPASLTMATSVAHYDMYSRSEWSWILGRFIVPGARLAEFEEAFAGLQIPTPGTRFTNWRLSALLGSDPVADVARIREFNSRMASSGSGRRAVVESIEVKAANSEEVKRMSGIIPAELATYFGIPPSSCGECIAAAGGCGSRAKIRTRGEAAVKSPASEGVIEFIGLCGAAQTPFKGVAGLPQPLGL